MKNYIKVFILLLFIIVAVGAVLIFVKTQVAPPGDIVFKDQYSAPLNADVEKVGVKPFPQCKDGYVKAFHKVNFMNEEGILNDEQADELRVKVDTVYGNRVVAYAYRIFDSSAWPEADINLISSTINDLKNSRLKNGKIGITQEMGESFNKVESIIREYRSAWTFARNTGFRSVADASSRIHSIGNYRNRPYIRNNTALMSALNNLPSAIATSHYNYVAAQVNKLGGYRSMSRSQFNSLVNDVVRVIEEYKNTGIYGGAKKSVSPLESRAESLVDEANEYYSYDNY